MKPIIMTTLHNPPTSHGDCLRASLASLLGVDGVHVPHFMEGGDVGWWPKFQAWCFERGIYPRQLDPSTTLPAGYYLALGVSLSGEPHCVVMQSDLQVHDPRPNGAGLVAFDKFVVLELTSADTFFNWRQGCA
jgi:hypothetical protein